jgi:hypothetical protein
MVETGPIPIQIQQQPVWFRAMSVPPTDWTEGVIVSVRKAFLRKRQVRIKFRTPFPYESFTTLVCGWDHLCEISDDDTPEHERDHFWK